MSDRTLPPAGTTARLADLLKRVGDLERRARYESSATSDFGADPSGTAIGINIDPASFPTDATLTLLSTLNVDPGAWVAFGFVAASLNIQDTNPPFGAYNPGQLAMRLALGDGTSSNERDVVLDTVRESARDYCLSGVVKFTSTSDVTATLRVGGAVYQTTGTGGGNTEWWNWGLWVLPG